MTKTESANRTVQAVVIEACEQLLECQMSAGARLAIPNTGNLIMVGPPEWIAKNVPGVEAMVAAVLTDERILRASEETAINYVTDERRPDNATIIDFARAIEREVIARLAATTQASTAQAERVPEGWKLVPVEPTPEIIAGAAIAAWPTASAADIALAQKAARIVLMQMDSAPGITADMLAATLATMAPAYRAMLDVAPAAPIAATSSTDAQAAAEVRDAAPAEPEHDPLYEKAVLIVRAHNRASVSLVQRHLLIGYNRASRIIEAMEAAGVVSASDDKGQRTVLRSAGDTGGTQIREEGSFYAVAKARGFTDFGLTISGKYSDDKLQALREQYDVEGAGDTGGTP